MGLKKLCMERDRIKTGLFSKQKGKILKRSKFGEHFDVFRTHLTFNVRVRTTVGFNGG